jgi:hypothetical protein
MRVSAVATAQRHHRLGEVIERRLREETAKMGGQQ